MTESANLSPQHEVHQIEDLMATLTSKVCMDSSLSYLSKEDYSKIYRQFKKLDTSIYNHKELSVDTNDRLDELTDIMSSMADLDFSREAEVREEYNHLDYIAISINLMRDRLEDRFASLSRIKAMFDALHELYIITDEEGTVLVANQALEQLYGIEKSSLQGKHIKCFFETATIKEHYNIDFGKDAIDHQTMSGLTLSKQAKARLKVSVRSFNLPDKKKGFVYKIAPPSSLGEHASEIAHEIREPVNFAINSCSGIEQAVKDIDDVMEKYAELDYVKTIEELQKKILEVNNFKQEIGYDLVKTEIQQALELIKEGFNRINNIAQNLSANE